MLRDRAELEMKLAYLVRKEWDENSVDYLVGVISSLCSEEQLEKIVERIK